MKWFEVGFLFISILCQAINVVAQHSDADSIYNTLAEVELQLNNGDLNTSLESLKSAIGSVPPELADSSLFEAFEEQVHLLIGELADSLAIELHEIWAGYLRQIFGMHLSSLQHLESAIEKANNDVTFEEIDLIRLLNQKVLTLGALQDWSNAKLVLLDLTQRCETGKHFKMLPTLYHNLGFVKIRLLEDGTTELMAGLKFLHQYDSTSQEGHNLYNSLGRRYLYLEKYRLANETFQSYVQWTGRHGFEQVPRAVVGLISTHIRLGQVDEARKIEEVFLQRLPKLSAVQQQEFYISISDAYIQSDPVKAIYYAQKGLEIPIDVFRSKLHFFLGFGYLETGKYRGALEQMQTYLAREFEGYDAKMTLSNPKYNEATDSRSHRPLAMKGKALLRLGQTENDVSLVRAGYEALLVGDSILQAFRSDLSRTERHSWNENQFYVALWSAATADELYKITNQPRYLEEIFKWSEKSKSLAHLDKVSREDLWRQLDIPNHLIARENVLVSLVNNRNGDLTNISKDSMEIRRMHASYQHELDLLRRKMELDYPQYYHLKHQPSTVTIRALQDFIAENQAVLSYFIAEQKVYSFLIEKDTIHYLLLQDDKGQIDDDLSLLHQGLAGRSPSYFQQARDIYVRLVDPLLQKTEVLDLIVITDRNLALVPFDLLISDIGEHRYLLEDYTISQYPSASLYVRPKSSRLNTERVLALSPSFDDSDPLIRKAAWSESDLIHLPGSKEEVEVLRDMWPGEYLLDEKATESIFKEKGHQFQLIHLSSHTLLNQEQEALDGIAMAPDESDDGLLNKMEIYQLDLGAELVTLSACNTGVGELARGDGISSLANAFHYAGCRNILMSLWAVQDATTVQFMTSFYRLIEEGYTLPAANRQAKIDFLSRANPKFRHPYYWGGFVMMGHHQQLDLARTSPAMWLVGIPLLILFIWMVYRFYWR